MSWDRDSERRAGKAMTIGGSVFGLVFSIVWCILAATMGAGIMLIFGIPFVCMMAYRLYVCIQVSKADKNKPRETDPWERPVIQDPPSSEGGSGFCPYCGGGIQESFEFCPKCGRKQP